MLGAHKYIVAMYIILTLHDECKCACLNSEFKMRVVLSELIFIHTFIIINTQHNRIKLK